MELKKEQTLRRVLGYNKSSIQSLEVAIPKLRDKGNMEETVRSLDESLNRLKEENKNIEGALKNVFI